MGHRANYLLIDESGHELFTSHWGGHRICLELFWGPQHAREYIRRQTATDTWLNDVWCEGGACLDFRTRELLVFSVEDLNYHVHFRSVWLHLMQGLWKGWTIRWAPRGIVDLAAKVDVPAQTVLAVRRPGREPVIEITDKRRPWCRTMATLRDSGRHYTLLTQGWEVLTRGPELIGQLKALRAAPLVHRDPPCCGIEIREGDRLIRYWAMHGRVMMGEMAQAAWKEWKVERNDDWAFAHLKELEPFSPPSEEEVLGQILQILTQEFGSPVDDVLALVSQRIARGHEVEVHPHALTDTRCELDAETKSLLLASALEAYHQGPSAPAYR